MAAGRSFYPVNWNGGTTGTNDPFGGSGIAVFNSGLEPTSRSYINRFKPRPQDRDSIVGGLVPNPYDVGFDFEFYRYMVPIPDYFMDYAGQAGTLGSEFGRNFRFRIRLIENNNQGGLGDQLNQPGPVPPPNPADDDDVYLVDNVAVMFPSSVPDIEAQAVKVI